MTKDIFCVMPICLRPILLHFTLRCLAQTRGIGRVHLVFIRTESGEITDTAMKRIADEAGVRPDEVHVLGCDKVPKPGREGWRQAFLLAHALFERSGLPLFLWLETDNLLNPDWLKKLVDMHKRAGQQVFVGIASPQRLTGTRAYRDIPTQIEADFAFRTVVQATIMLIGREAMLSVKRSALTDKDKRCEAAFRGLLVAGGRCHVVPLASTTQHVVGLGTSRGGGRWHRHGRGGVGFVPHRDIRFMWELCNSDIVGTEDDPGTANEPVAA